jgi:lipoate-protein ligase A
VPTAPLQIGRYDRDDDMIAATRQDRRPRVRAYCPTQTAVVLGRGSRPEVELNVEACVADGVPILKRRGGGCAVVLDTGNVIVSATLPTHALGGVRRHFARLSEWLIDGLARIGVVGVRREGTSDLALGDRKIGGACIYSPKGALFYSASLLIEPDIALVERYLKHPPREPAYRRARRHADFMGALIDLPNVDSALHFADRLRAALQPPGL